MSERTLISRVSFILEMISNIDLIVNRHGGIDLALEDVEGKMAIYMGITQIGETLAKLDDEFLLEYGLLKEKKGAYYTRNYIVHEYEGVDPFIIEEIYTSHLPHLSKKLQGFLRKSKQ